MKKAVLSCSGGLDSTCLLMNLLSQKEIDGSPKYDEVNVYSFNYGQKHTIELKKLKKNIKFLQNKGFNITSQIIDLESAFTGNTSSLVSSTGKEIPKGDYNDENMASTVVPLRNVIFSAIIYSKALNLAIKSGSNVDIALGIHGGDHFIYPDCRPESYKACEEAFKISDEHSNMISYQAPFVNHSKSEVLAIGLESMKNLGFTKAEINKVLKNTHSCYTPNEKGESCGECGTCRERLEAFESVGMKDPIKYVN